ncbi:unnamed protein product [Pedinophyceae sp. YPF-701]|nr:unnamed protein product [Pedinophyceae sp. YPF-701]
MPLKKGTQEVDTAELHRLPLEFGVVKAKGELTEGGGWGGGPAACAFDGRTDATSGQTAWIDPTAKKGAGSWIVFALTKNHACALTAYSLTSAGDPDTNDPCEWVLEASEDGKSWVQVDARKDVKFKARWQTQTFKTRWNVAARSWRLTVIRTRGGKQGTGLHLGELGLWVDKPAWMMLQAAESTKARAAATAKTQKGLDAKYKAKPVEDKGGGVKQKAACVACGAAGVCGGALACDAFCGTNICSSICKCLKCFRCVLCC